MLFWVLVNKRKNTIVMVTFEICFSLSVKSIDWFAFNVYFDSFKGSFCNHFNMEWIYQEFHQGAGEINYINRILKAALRFSSE